MRIGIVIAAALVLVACSKSDDTRLKQDMHGVGHDLTAAGASIKNDPDIHDVGAETRRTAADAGKALKNTADEAAGMAQGAAADAKDDAARAGRDTRHAADDVRRNVSDN